jgi:hypothetical protein
MWGGGETEGAREDGGRRRGGRRTADGREREEWREEGCGNWNHVLKTLFLFHVGIFPRVLLRRFS